MLTYYQKIYHLTGGFSTPCYNYDRLELIEDYGIDFKKPISIGKEIIEVSLEDIVGTTHSDYKNLKNWLEFFDNLKKAQSIESIEYYANFFNNESYLKDCYDIYMVKFKSKFWISGGGNHRLCIARILGMKKLALPVSFY